MSGLIKFKLIVFPLVRFAEADLQQDLKNFPFTVVEGPGGGLLVELMYEKVWEATFCEMRDSRRWIVVWQDGGDCETRQFTPEQLLAMLFINLRWSVAFTRKLGRNQIYSTSRRSTAEAHNKSASPDCVISVPCWFTDAQVKFTFCCNSIWYIDWFDVQRRGVLDAGTIAGLNVLRVMNETAATALCWGLPKSLEFPEDSAPPKNALFFDMGHSSTQVLVSIWSQYFLKENGLWH